MYFAYTYEAEMDINSEDKVRIAMNVQSGAKEDIEAGYDAYRCEVVSSNGVLITGKTEEYVKGEGFDAVLALRSGSEEGEAEFHCITPDTVLSGGGNYGRPRSDFHACGKCVETYDGSDSRSVLCLSQAGSQGSRSFQSSSG